MRCRPRQTTCLVENTSSRSRNAPKGCRTSLDVGSWDIRPVKSPARGNCQALAVRSRGSHLARLLASPASRGDARLYRLRRPHQNDAHLRFEHPGAAAGGALSRPRQPGFIELEAADTASRRFDHDLMPCRARRTDQMSQVVLDVSTLQTELSRNRRHRSRPIGEDVQKILAEHRPTYLLSDIRQ